MRPPFDLTPAVLGFCTRIERLIGRCEGLGGAVPAPQLRRRNRIRTVQATAAIEGNTLSVDQVTAVLDGKRVRGSVREIAEVANAIAAYELVARLDPHSERDLLRAHGVLMAGVSDDAGRYRRGNVGILTGSRVTHVAPKASRVPALMNDLFQFLATDRDTPAVVSASVFHYELELIHPFSDGNGRIGRLWQHTLLRRHSPLFEHLPTESLIKARQADYYDALARSDRAGNATPFLVFMLEQLEQSLSQFFEEFRPARTDASTRLSTAAAHFGAGSFSRKDYMAVHKGISQATASRDLRAGVAGGALIVRGDKATARYVFARAGARSAPRSRANRRSK
jgi:Fic family protein